MNSKKFFFTILVNASFFATGCLLRAETIKSYSSADAEQSKRVEALTSQIKLTPKEPLLYARRADAHRRLMEFPLALEDINKAIELAPRTGKFHSVKASVYNAMGKSDLERSELELAVTTSPDDVFCLKKLAAFLGTEHETSRACELLTKAISIEPNDAQSYIFRADVYIRMQDFSKASLDCSTAEKLGWSGADISAMRNTINDALAKKRPVY